MIPPGSRFHRRFTDAEMDQIRSTMKQHGSQAGFDCLWDIILQEAENLTADEGIERGLKFEVRDYAIPSEQDTELQRILSVSPSRASRKRWDRKSTGMTFLFYGPAIYDDLEDEGGI